MLSPFHSHIPRSGGVCRLERDAACAVAQRATHGDVPRGLGELWQKLLAAEAAALAAQQQQQSTPGGASSEHPGCLQHHSMWCIVVVLRHKLHAASALAVTTNDAMYELCMELCCHCWIRAGSVLYLSTISDRSTLGSRLTSQSRSVRHDQ